LDAKALIPPWATQHPFFSITRTEAELSVVCVTVAVPDGIQAEHGWRAFGVEGPIPFDAVGILAELARRLAAAGVSIFAVSTYDTDYLLVRDADVDRSIAALREAGHTVQGVLPLSASDIVRGSLVKDRALVDELQREIGRGTKELHVQDGRHRFSGPESPAPRVLGVECEAGGIGPIAGPICGLPSEARRVRH
jgi:hypothetical protein